MQSVLKKKNGFAYIFDLSKEKNPRDIVNGLNNVSLSVEMIEIVNSFPTLDPRLYLFFFSFFFFYVEERNENWIFLSITVYGCNMSGLQEFYCGLSGQILLDRCSEIRKG